MLMAPDDLTYLLNLTDLSYAMNALPVTVRRVVPGTPVPVNNLYNEVIQKPWESRVLNVIVIPNPEKEIMDRFAARTPVKLMISVAQDELTRKGWTPDPEDVWEYYNADGKKSDFYPIQCLNDGVFRDTEGRETPLSYTLTLTDQKSPT